MISVYVTFFLYSEPLVPNSEKIQVLKKKCSCAELSEI
jgi:hypothetical protein